MIKTRVKKETYTICDGCLVEFKPASKVDHGVAIEGKDICSSCAYLMSHNSNMAYELSEAKSKLEDAQKKYDIKCQIRDRLKELVKLVPSKAESEKFVSKTNLGIVVGGDKGVNTKVAQG